MNQILCGDIVIDTDDVQLAIKIEGEDAQRRVFLRGGKTAILRGEEEAAFDLWAATLPRAGRDVHRCESCARNIDGMSCTRRPSEETFPECHVAREDETQPDPRPLCLTCACCEAESGYCTEFAGNHYPECWVARKEAADCKLCRHYRSCEYCMRGKEREWSGCFETREAEAKPPEKAKVLLLSRIWECSKCSEVLATDLDCRPANMTDPQGGEIIVEGKVRIQVDGILSVTCWQCQTANLWPDELRERIGRRLT